MNTLPLRSGQVALACATLVWMVGCGGGGGSDGVASAGAPPGTVAATTPGTVTDPAVAPTDPAVAPTQPAGPGVQAAVLQSPSAESKLLGNSATFSWAATTGTEYQLTVEIAGVATPLYDSKTTGTSLTVSNLPTNGAALVVHLRTRDGDSWLSSDTHFVSAGYTAAQSDAATTAWTAPIALPLVPVSGANLADGKMLLWSANQIDSFGPGGQTYTTVFDPVAQTATRQLVTNTGHAMFCPGISMLADGGILVTGGSDSAMTTRYDPASTGWVTEAQMNIPRGYQASATMGDGAVFTVGGSWSGAAGGKAGEVWSPVTKTWRTLASVPSNMPAAGDTIPPLNSADAAGVYRADNHMWLFGHDNWVFHAGPSAAMHWIDTRGAGKLVSAGPRGDSPAAMNGDAVMYDTGKILTLGGTPNYDTGNAYSAANVIDISAGPPTVPTVRRVAPMAYGRTFANSIVLPNGEVVVIGGQTIPRGFSDDYSVLAAELWNPVTERFITLSPMTIGRNYHSIALLLMDGRVMSAGGGLCGTGCAANHADSEILTPPYLLNADGTAATRPVITAAPASATWGAEIAVQTDAAVRDFSLVRMGSTTHTVNTDQRRISLTATRSGDQYKMTIPSDRGVVLPGNYMLFAMNARGVPSVARLVNVH